MMNDDKVKTIRHQLEESRQVIGYILHKLRFKAHKVPQDLAVYMTSKLDSLQFKDQDMLAVLNQVSSVLDDLIDAQRKVAKLKPLKAENKELLKLIHQEHKNRRLLQN